MIGMSTAHADAGDVFPVNTDLGQADQVLTYDQPILSSATVPPQFETALSEQTAILNNALTTLNHAEALQGPAGAAQELYSGADELFRTASVAFEPASATFAELPSTSTEYNLLLPELQHIGATYDLSFVDSLSQVFGLGGPVSTGAAADSAATLATVRKPSSKHLRQTHRAGRSGRALADHPRLRHDGDVLVLAGRGTRNG
jgi:hypothetical protein